jgi:hypothetical protein
MELNRQLQAGGINLSDGRTRRVDRGHQNTESRDDSHSHIRPPEQTVAPFNRLDARVRVWYRNIIAQRR